MRIAIPAASRDRGTGPGELVDTPTSSPALRFKPTTKGVVSPLRERIELTEETGATYTVPEQPEEADRSETPVWSGSASSPVALCLVGAFLLGAFLVLIRWAISVGRQRSRGAGRRRCLHREGEGG